MAFSAINNFSNFGGMNQAQQFGGFPAGGGQNPMMQMMQMMMTMMMTLMAQQMGGGLPGAGMPGQTGFSPIANPGFGGGPGMAGGPGCGCGPMGGSPMGNFLGGNPGFGNFPQMGGPGAGFPPAGSGPYGSAGTPGGPAGPGGSPPMGPAGNVGNVNIERLVAALPRGHQNAARQHFPTIVAEANRQGVTNKAQLAYILATTVHESGAGAHMEEFASGRAYEGRRSLGNTQPGDGVRFKGRGYVQITGRRNYTDWSRRLGMDLVGNPNLAKNPQVAARILVGGMKDGTFTGRRLDQYINNNQTDFRNARRIVNGMDKADTFAQTAQRLLAAMN